MCKGFFNFLRLILEITLNKKVKNFFIFVIPGLNDLLFFDILLFDKNKYKP